MTDIDTIEKKPWLSKKEWAISLLPFGPDLYRIRQAKQMTPDLWARTRRMYLVYGLAWLALLPVIGIGAMWSFLTVCFVNVFLVPSSTALEKLVEAKEQKALASACESEST